MKRHPLTLFAVLPFILGGWTVGDDDVGDTHQMLEVLADVVDVHYDETGAFPATGQVSTLEDPWGSSIRYFRVSDRGFLLLSFGADGQPGGDADNADLVIYRSR